MNTKQVEEAQDTERFATLPEQTLHVLGRIADALEGIDEKLAVKVYAGYADGIEVGIGQAIYDKMDRG